MTANVCKSVYPWVIVVLHRVIARTRVSLNKLNRTLFYTLYGAHS
jgi:hypothetical protein